MRDYEYSYITLTMCYLTDPDYAFAHVKRDNNGIRDER